MNLKKPKFWDYKKPNIYAYLLFPLTVIIKFFKYLRKNSKKKLEIKTICVGNIYIGGTGKTSLCIKINQALSKRLNLNSNITRNTVEIYEYAKIKNTNFTKLITIPENDTWVYNDGISMVCNVFACRVFKESGIFGDISSLIQCSEFQNWDTYSLNLFNETVSHI